MSIKLRLITAILFLPASFLSLAAKAGDVSFSRISVARGAYSSARYPIYIDENDIIWIGVGDKLKRYDSNGLTSFDVFDDESSITINDLVGDKNGNIYLASESGVYEFNQQFAQTNRIVDANCRDLVFDNKLYYTDDGKIMCYNPESGTLKCLADLPGYIIRSILPCDDGSFWAGTVLDGAYKVSPKGEIDAHIECGYFVNQIYRDSKDNIWFSSQDKGVTVLTKSGEIKSFRHKPSDSNSLMSDFVRCFCEDERGNMWLGTFISLDCYNYESGKFSHYVNDPANPASISHNSIWDIKINSQGTVWVSTYYGKINYFSPGYEIYNKYKMPSQIITCIIQDNSGDLWVGTGGGGLCRVNPETGKVKVYSKSTSSAISGEHLKCLYFDSGRSVLWIGHHINGLDKLNLKTGRISSQKYYRGDVSSRSNNVRAIQPYRDSLIIGTDDGLFVSAIDGGGREIKNDKSGRFRSIVSLLYDNYGTVWVVSGRGELWTYNTSNGEIKKWVESGVSSKPYYSSVYQDFYGNIWIGYEGGFCCYRPSSEEFIHYNSSNGYDIGGKVIGIAESKLTKSLLLLTSEGLVFFDRKSGSVRLLNRDNGFPLADPKDQSILTLSDGTIFVGGIQGLYSFKEKDANFSYKPYNLFFSNLYINGKLSDSSLQYKKDLTLGPEVSIFSIEFATSNHIAAINSGMEYMLEGFSSEWNDCRGHNTITYSNLSPGKYTLHVRAAGPDKSICEPISIRINVKSPWYASFWAIIIYVIIAAVLIYRAIAVVKSRIKLQESLMYEQNRAAAIEELNQAKLRFFTNISHEIRTPLTIIIAEVESIIQQHNFSPALYKKVLAIYKNSMSLQELINELLEFRKQEQGEMKIRVSPHNIVSLVNEVYLLYGEYAVSKGIKLIFCKDIDRLEVWYDQSQMQKVFNNIIANAILYTDKGGAITICVSSEKQNAVISISDTGCGIPASDLPNIFDRFYQVEKDEGEDSRQGTGIGLSLAKGIVKLHGGDIEVVSKEGEGSTFKIILPLGYSHFSKEQLSETSSIQVLDVGSDVTEPQTAVSLGDEGKEHKMVIAEDNDGVRSMLTELFSPIYQVFAAEDGKAALKLVYKEMPSIVVSDVLMPEMSGIELCNKIKTDIQICHIPVVLLTARTSVEQNFEGLQTGADDYITKPFNTTLLISRCNNLVNSRLMLQEKFSNSPSESSRILATNQLDKEFIDKATAIVQENLANPDFNVADFARAIAKSRTGLFTKIKAITGGTPNEFVLLIRLKAAARMLCEQPDKSVAEIASETGFASQRYFSTCFKQHYKITPLAFRKNKDNYEKN